MKNKRILVVLGGTSGERKVSLDSGKACVKALKKIGYKKISTFDPKKKSYSSKEYNRYSNVPVLGALENKLKIILRSGLIKVFGIKFLNKIGKKLYNINERNS